MEVWTDGSALLQGVTTTRQNSDKPAEIRLLEAITDMVIDVGDTTAVNGIDWPQTADWLEAQPNRAQQFIKPDEVGRPVYEVTFAGGKVLGHPWNLEYGSELRWGPTGWTFVVRRVSPDTSSDVMIDVNVLAVLAPRQKKRWSG